MKRSRATLADVAAWGNLTEAFAAAARGKRGRADVEAFRADLDRNLDRLRARILGGGQPFAPMRAFTIRDPKIRLIHAPVFEERVLHHALMAVIGPALDATLVDDTYACRTGKGALAAAWRARTHLRRAGWWGQIDVAQCFPSIDHAALRALIARKISDHDLLRLIDGVLSAHGDGQGLPIGALTSQHFANLYLGSADRLALCHPEVRGYVRYMDDMIWWSDSRAGARAALAAMVAHLEGPLRLSVKTPRRIGRSADGLSFCGWRITRAGLRLSRRRKSRYAAARADAEAAFAAGLIDARALQSRIDAALAPTLHAGAAGWRRNQLLRSPMDAAVEAA